PDAQRRERLRIERLRAGIVRDVDADVVEDVCHWRVLPLLVNTPFFVRRCAKFLSFRPIVKKVGPLRAREWGSRSMVAALAPGWRGATKAHTCWYVTEEQRSQPGCIGREGG